MATGSEQVGTLVNAGLDLGTSGFCLARSVPKVNKLGMPERSWWRHDPNNYEAAINQVTRTGLSVEAMTSSGTIIDALILEGDE